MVACLSGIHFLSNSPSFHLGIQPALQLSFSTSEWGSSLSLSTWVKSCNWLKMKRGTAASSVRVSSRLLLGMERQTLAFPSDCEPGRNIICAGMVMAICDQEGKNHPKRNHPRNGRSKGQRERHEPVTELTSPTQPHTYSQFLPSSSHSLWGDIRMGYALP